MSEENHFSTASRGASARIPIEELRVLVVEDFLEYPAQDISPEEIRFQHLGWFYENGQEITLNILSQDTVIIGSLRCEVIGMEGPLVRCLLSDPAPKQVEAIASLITRHHAGTGNDLERIAQKLGRKAVLPEIDLELEEEPDEPDEPAELREFEPTPLESPDPNATQPVDVYAFMDKDPALPDRPPIPDPEKRGQELEGGKPVLSFPFSDEDPPDYPWKRGDEGSTMKEVERAAEKVLDEELVFNPSKYVAADPPVYTPESASHVTSLSGVEDDQLREFESEDLLDESDLIADRRIPDLMNQALESLADDDESGEESDQEALSQTIRIHTNAYDEDQAGEAVPSSTDSEEEQKPEDSELQATLRLENLVRPFQDQDKDQEDGTEPDQPARSGLVFDPQWLATEGGEGEDREVGEGEEPSLEEVDAGSAVAGAEIEKDEEPANNGEASGEDDEPVEITFEDLRQEFAEAEAEVMEEVQEAEGEEEGEEEDELSRTVREFQALREKEAEAEAAPTPEPEQEQERESDPLSETVLLDEGEASLDPEQLKQARARLVEHALEKLNDPYDGPVESIQATAKPMPEYGPAGSRDEVSFASSTGDVRLDQTGSTPEQHTTQDRTKEDASGGRPEGNTQAPRYFRVLNLHDEPFSNSPDPDYFYPAGQHSETLERLEIAIRLRRGLNVVLGAVGTGKTTMCRRLHQSISDDDEIVTHLFLEPLFNSGDEFLIALIESFTGEEPPAYLSQHQLLELAKTELFKLSVDQGRIVVLLLDEGQRLPEDCIELLRLLLNYETNQNKLLQIAIFAQSEFKQVIKKHPNFNDRINELITLAPLTLAETREMIAFRLEKASLGAQAPGLFSRSAIWAVHKLTRGYPRRVVRLCHKILLSLIMKDKDKATLPLVLQSRGSKDFRRKRGLRKGFLWLALALIAGLALLFILKPDLLKFGGSPQETTETEDVRPTPTPEPAPTATPAATAEPTAMPTEQPAIVPTASVTEEPDQGESVEEGAGSESVSEDAAVGVEIESTETLEDPDVPPDFDSGELDDTGVAPGPDVVLEYPEVLGGVEVGGQDLLSTLIYDVYGLYNPDLLNVVLEANPDLGDIDSIRIGQMILFPPIEAVEYHFPGERVWLRLGASRELSQAHRLLKQYREMGLETYLVGHWDKQNGLVFSLFLQESFSKDASSFTAVDGLADLPQELRGQAEVVQDLPESTMFFNNKQPAP